ncbi:MAG: hypothetical protein JWO46_2862 [Nocardioidaceae bacterium]|nr:hypothetical protein [Nocardioidaceae bacterium]
MEPAAPDTAGPGVEHVITLLGEPEEPARVVPDQVVLSATLGEPLVKAIALGHGVRRALGAEARNRIRFEMRREVKRARKGRRREMRVAWRQMRAQESVPQQRREDVA